MNSKTFCLSLLAISLTASLTFATSYTFSPTGASTTEGDWSDIGDWAPSGTVPGPGDTVTIPTGKTCIIQDTEHQYCDALTVDSGGTLQIENANITIDDADNMTSGLTSTINGTVVVNGTANTGMLFGWGHTLTGSGRIETRDEISGDGGGCLIFFRHLNIPNTSVELEIAGSLTLEGSFSFNMNVVVGTGVNIEMSESYHHTTFGFPNNTTHSMDFSGTFTMSAGTTNVQRMNFGTSSGEINLVGGTLKFGYYSAAPNTVSNTRLIMVVRGGLLDIDTNFAASGIQFVEACTITVAPEKTAMWDVSL